MLVQLTRLDREKLRVLITRFADLYRLILAGASEQRSTLTTELNIITHLLEIQKQRFQKRLSYAIEGMAPEPTTTPIPTLLLLTLVENLIQHGITKLIQGGQVGTRIALATDSIAIGVWNTGAPLAQAWSYGTGLAYTEPRLQWMYPDRHGHSVGSDSDGTTHVRFNLPRWRHND